MKWKEKLANLQALLAEGKTEEVIDQTQFLDSGYTRLSPENKAEACAFRGMAYYRRKDFGHAHFWFMIALGSDPQNERAIYGMAYLAVYVDKNPEKTNEWMAKLPESAAKDNASMIMMRAAEYIEANGLLKTEDNVGDLVEKWLNPNPEDSLNVANLLHNAARFYIVDSEKYLEAGSQQICMVAVGLLQSAIGLYGTGNMNLHHRAAANYWISVAMEKLFGPAAATSAAAQSIELWYRQLELDPKNPQYSKSLQGASDRLIALRKAALALQ